MHTTFFSWWSLVKQQTLKTFLRQPNKWQSGWVKSSCVVGVPRPQKCSYWNVWTARAAVWGQALPCNNTAPCDIIPCCLPCITCFILSYSILMCSVYHCNSFQKSVSITSSVVCWHFNYILTANFVSFLSTFRLCSLAHNGWSMFCCQ
jgi:hypothetical protein